MRHFDPIKLGGFSRCTPIPNPLSPPMSSSRTTTQTTTAVGSIPITGGTDYQPSELTCLTTPDPSDEECELELQLERTREKKRKMKEEKKRAEEEAKQKVEEERQKQEAATRAANARKMEEEAAEKRRKIAAAAAAWNRRGPLPSEATTSACRVEGEVPRVVRKGKTPQRNKASGGDPDDGDDGGNDDNDNEEEQAPCEQCYNKKIPCLEQPVQVRREGGLSRERMAVMESQMAQLLADNQALRESASRSHQYLRQLLRPQDEDHGPLRSVSEKPRTLKRRRIIENSKAEQEEEREIKEKEVQEGEEEGEEEEEEEPVPKKAWSEKGKEREDL
ncbi:hypothetical protein EV359DRAFT_86855 [Lentinula novae-zelandiae]|nr:hypothetical protein EV359DRAFT_86855 [Lentinula novae-zelandiae]